MKYFLKKFLILIFGLLTAHGIPQHEVITEPAEPEYLSPITPLFVLNTMEDLFSKYMFNNYTNFEKPTEWKNEAVDTALEEESESKMPIDITSTDKSVFETESTSKVTSNSETTTLVSKPGGTDPSTVNIPETNSETIIQTTENVNNKETSVDTSMAPNSKSNSQTDTTSENNKIITSTENIVTSTKMTRESATFSEAVDVTDNMKIPPTEGLQQQPHVTLLSKPTESGNDDKSPHQFTTTERASSKQTMMSEPVSESQSPSTEITSTENIVTSTKTKIESGTYSETVKTEDPQHQPDVTSPRTTTENKNQIDIRPLTPELVETSEQPTPQHQFTTTERASSIHTMLSEPVSESQSPSTEITSTENIVTSTKTKIESGTFSETVKTEDPQHQPDVTSPRTTTENKNQIDKKPSTPELVEISEQPTPHHQFTTTERASSIHTMLSEPVSESQSPSTEIISTENDPSVITSSKTTAIEDKTESIESTDKQDSFDIAFHPNVNSKPPTTYDITTETVATHRASEIAHESGRITTQIIPKATMSGSGDTHEKTSHNINTDSIPNLTVTKNCSTTPDPVASVQHENGTINHDKQNKTITCIESKMETTTIKTTATTTFRPRPAISSISLHTQLATNEISTNPTTTFTTNRNSHFTPKENDATIPQIPSIILISISFFYCHILMKQYNLRIW